MSKSRNKQENVEIIKYRSEMHQKIDVKYRRCPGSVQDTCPECMQSHHRLVFEPCMQRLRSQYGGSWRYTTNCLFPIYQRCRNRAVPFTTNLMPNGTISDKSSLRFVVKISTLQMRQAVDCKLKIFFSDPSIIAAIIVNVDETPSYASPGETKNWDSGEFMHWSGWNNIGRDAWGPITFAGHCWGGEFSCQIEIHWSSHIVNTDQSFKVVSSTNSIHIIDTNILTFPCSSFIQGGTLCP
jgi:hypothetical protein